MTTRRNLLWHECYPALSQVRPGLYGAATSRAEAQVLRLSAIYAVLDCSPIMPLPHLQAALAVWDYCSASASLFFGTSTGDHTADRILEAINASGGGLSRKQIVLSSRAISAAAASKPHSNNSYRWVPSTKPAGRPGAAPLPSGLPYRIAVLGRGRSSDESTDEETDNEESMQEQTGVTPQSETA